MKLRPSGGAFSLRISFHFNSMTQNHHPHNFPLKAECLELVEISLELHKKLGNGLSGLAYKNAFENELIARGIPYSKEKRYAVNVNGLILAHKFHCDFLVNNGIIVEIKSIPFLITENDLNLFHQLILSKPKIGLIINFNSDLMQFKKVVLI